MSTYAEKIISEMEERADNLDRYAIRINVQDFALDEEFILTMIKIPNDIQVYYISDNQSYTEFISNLDEDLQSEIYMLLTESLDEDIEVVEMEEVWLLRN